MKFSVLPLYAAALLLSDTPELNAQEFELYAGATFTSEYVDQGIKYSDGLAVQPYLEFWFGNAYAGIWSTNAARNRLGADGETDFYIGYSGRLGRVDYDLSYTYYTFGNPTRATRPYDEVILSLTTGLTDTLYTTLSYGHAERFDQNDIGLTFDYYSNYSGLSFSATYGDVESNFGDWEYWSVGVTMETADYASWSFAYHDTNDAVPIFGNAMSTNGEFIFSLNFDFSVR